MFAAALFSAASRNAATDYVRGMPARGRMMTTEQPRTKIKRGGVLGEFCFPFLEVWG
jgi:hypothetical protein